MYKLCDKREETQEMRMCVVNSIIELMKENDKVLALDADLASASGFSKIEKNYPRQFIQCGIAEANMVGVSAGISLLGYISFIHSFGPFVSRRVFDQVFVSGAYADTNINIYGSDPGFCVAQNGGTHTTWEDVALMRTIPHAIICDAADGTQMKWIIKNFAKLHGIHYVRGNRKPVRNIYTADSEFEFGKGNILKKGTDVLVISAGQIVSDALDASEELDKNNISVEVIDMFTIKPIDKELILNEAKGKKIIITFENHSIIGGLGSAVSEVLSDNGVGIKLKRMGVDEQFGQVGTAEWLQKEYHLTKDDLIKEIKKFSEIE